MTKEMRELYNSIKEKKEAAKALVLENKLEEAKELKNEIANMTEKYDLMNELYEEDKKEVEKKMENKETKKEIDAVKEFANAARCGFRVNNKMNEGTQLDGGYTVPEDILTRINTYRQSKKSLKDLVTVEVVTTNKGQRTFKKRAQQTGFVKVGEGGKIGAKATPQFERISYEIDKYAGYFPVTNELLADSDANITNTLIEWIGDESRVTANKLILDTIKTLEEVELNGLDDIKKALNVTLGSAFKSTSKIITNDDGLQYLDTLKDSEGKYLLQPNPANPMEMRLCAGATIVPIEVIPNDDMPTDENKVPFIIGDLKEGIIFWDRQQMNIKMSDLAVIGELNAFEEDLTLFRAIEREDVTKRDEKAVVNGYITLP